MKQRGALFNLQFKDELVVLAFASSELNVHVFEHIQHTAETVRRSDPKGNQMQKNLKICYHEALHR
jgi:hypothetical protein